MDAHLSPSVASWLADRFGVEARSLTRLGLGAATDHAAFQAAREAGVDALLTKDEDFEHIVRRFGPPPAIVVLVCGNAANAEIRSLLEAEFERAVGHIRRGEPIVEIGRVA